jgi:hypothetical protein
MPRKLRAVAVSCAPRPLRSLFRIDVGEGRS